MKLLTLSALFLSAGTALAQPAAARTDAAVLQQTVEQFLQVQTGGLPGKVSLSVGPIEPRLSLGACAAPEAFLMPGARAWGRTTVGVRCAAPSVWTVYIQAKVTVEGDYVASAVPLAQGQPIVAAQLTTLRGDLTALPPGVATDASQVVGRSSNLSLPAGVPLRLDTLRSRQVVLQGQLVRLVSNGNGFSISSEGKAAANAAEGQVVQVRTASGQSVSGVARAGGLVEVAF